MVTRSDSDGGRPIDADGERLVVVCLARSREELGELARRLEAEGLAPVVLEPPPGGLDGPARLAVPESQVAEARRLMGGGRRRSRSLLASLERRIGRAGLRVVLVVLFLPLVVSLFFGIWMLGLAALGAVVVVSAAASLADGVRRFFGSRSGRNRRTPGDDA